MRTRTTGAAVRLAVAGMALCAVPFTAQAAQAAASGTQTVAYLGHSFTVPASWPVVQLSPTSTTCVRFNQHTVYLGAAPANQDCPDRVLGRTDAIELEPARSGAPTGATEDATGRQITSTGSGVTAVATYASSPSQVDGILSSAGLPLPPGATSATRQGTAAPSAALPLASAAAGSAAAKPATVPVSATQYSGFAFDACSAPSEATMAAWKANSTFGALGIYIGGENEACSQPNLTPAWVAAEAAAGWHFFLLYVGPQAPGSSCSSCGIMTDPATDGAASAQDAYTEATSLGFGPGTPIFFDMEAYSSAGTSDALAFISAWTGELHALSFDSAEYGSEGSVITDLVNNYGTIAEPDAIDFANWNGTASTGDPGIPEADWSSTTQQIHQYSGGTNLTYGGVEMNVDQNAMGMDAPAPPTPVSAGQPTVLANSDGTSDVYAVRHDGSLWGAQSLASGGFTAWQAISTGLNLVGKPAVIRLSNGIIAIYARTRSGVILGTSQISVGGPFSAWGQMGTGVQVASDPTAIVTAAGVIAIYAADTSGRIDGTSQSVAFGPFGSWQALSTPLGFSTQPAVIQTSSGVIAIYALDSSGAILGASQSVVAGPFGGWGQMGDQSNLVSNPTVIITAAGLIAIYASDANGVVDGTSQNVPYGPFGAWQALSPALGFAGQPAVVQAPNGNLAIYAQTGGTIMGTSQSVVQGPFSAWSQVGTGDTLTSNPSALITTGGQLQVFAADTTGGVAEDGQPFGPWTAA